MKLFARCQQGRGRHGGASGNSHITEECISSKRKGQHAGDCRRCRQTSSRPVLVATEQGDGEAVSGERQAEDNAAGDAWGLPQPLFRQGLRQSSGQAAEQTRDRERADSRGAAAGLRFASAPAPFEPDQEPDAEREAKAGNQLVEVHGPVRPSNRGRSRRDHPERIGRPDGANRVGAARSSHAGRLQQGRVHMNVRGGRRGPRTWLAIQAST